MRTKKKLLTRRPKVLVTAGSAEIRLHRIERHLTQFGVQQPLAVAESRVPTIADWMNKMASRQSRNPGKALQLALGELFLANLDDPGQTLWGWADHRNTDLLDFFLDFDDQIHFLLVIESPQSMLALRALTDETDDEKVQEEAQQYARQDALASWRDSVNLLLQFHREQPNRSLLTNNLEWQFDSPSALARVANWLDQPYSCEEYSELEDVRLADQAMLTLAQVITPSKDEFVEADRLWQEVLALSPSPDEAVLSVKATEVSVAFIQRALAVEKTHAGLIDDLHALNAEMKALESSQEELRDLKEENELLLAQLHQVQEELENYYLKHKESEQRLTEADQNLRRLKRRLRQQARGEGMYWDYEAIHLIRIVDIPDYESIWMAIEDAKFGEESWPRLEFRLSAANNHPETFSRQPHYEFPNMAVGKQVFDQWFLESVDDLRGERFELRFNLAEGAMDMTAWNRLSKNDRLKLAGLMLAVPQFLDELADEAPAPARGWEPWKQINQEALTLLSQLVKQ